MNMFGGKFKNNGYGSTNMLNAQKNMLTVIIR